MSHVHVPFVLVVGLWFSVPAVAQPLGTFRWQLQPYCNVLTLNVGQQGSVYTLDGTDDGCGAAQMGSARGVAFLNPNGTIGFGLTIIYPGGTAVHLEAAMNLASLSGTWRDSSSAFGNFVLTPGPGAGGPMRSIAANGIAPGSIVAPQLAPGAVGSVAIAPGAVTSAQVADGSLTTADLLDGPRAGFLDGIDSVSLYGGDNPATTFPFTIREVTVVAPAAGRVIVSSSGWIYMPNTNTADFAVCSITTGTNVPIPFTAYAREQTPTSYRALPLGGTRGFTVPAGAFTVRLNCLGAGAQIVDASLTAIFVAGS